MSEHPRRRRAPAGGTPSPRNLRASSSQDLRGREDRGRGEDGGHSLPNPGARRSDGGEDAHSPGGEVDEGDTGDANGSVGEGHPWHLEKGELAGGAGEEEEEVPGGDEHLGVDGTREVEAGHQSHGVLDERRVGVGDAVDVITRVPTARSTVVCR